MSRSTRLSTAAHILFFLEKNPGKRVKIDDIAKTTRIHPSRLRQICSLLVQRGLVRSFKGARGGIEAHPAAKKVNFYELAQCVDDTNFFTLTLHEPEPSSKLGVSIVANLTKYFKDCEKQVIYFMKNTKVLDMIPDTPMPVTK